MGLVMQALWLLVSIVTTGRKTMFCSFVMIGKTITYLTYIIEEMFASSCSSVKLIKM